MPPPKKDAGFSIIEVLVAFVILSLVVTMCLQVYASSAKAETMARWNEQAHVVLRDKLAAIPTLELQPGQEVNGAAADGLRWSITVGQPVGDGTAGSGRLIIWYTAQVTDPTGRVYSASTTRWMGEAYPQGAPA